MLQGKTIVVCVTGSISAYKAADLVSQLVKLHAKVHVVMTDAACKVISPLPFEALSGRHCILDGVQGRQAQLDELAANADLVMVAPASANTIGYLALGGTPSAVAHVTLAALSAGCPVMVAPAMNTEMYRNPAVQANLETLSAQGFTVIPPASGHLACGATGPGKLPPVDELVDWACRAIACEHDLVGKRIVVSAGPTCEDIDPVRYITNHSTGRMGFAIARQAMLRGAQATVVCGPVSITPPRFIETVPVRSAQQMFEAITSCADDADAIVMAAAVADYRPKNVASEKIKKAQGGLPLELERTQDILAYLGQHRNGRTRLCGFAMETQDVLENAQSKLTRKNVDMICANSLRESGAGFGTATNHLTLITADGLEDLPMLSKEDAADRLLTKLFRLPPK